MSNTDVTFLVGACCLVFGLGAFTALIVAPAMSAYRTYWEKGAAMLLSVYVLAALAGIGVLVGYIIFSEWPNWFS
jgi:hypothetical protein